MCLVYTALVSCDQCNAVTQFKIMVDKTANKIECQDCMICPPGEEAHPPCESSIIHFVPVNQSCGRCHEGYFKSQPNEFQCNQCKICVKGQPYVQNCTAEKDAECSTACIYGMYMGKDWHCHPCCPCHSGENLFEFQCASFPGKNCRGTSEDFCVEDLPTHSSTPAIGPTKEPTLSSAYVKHNKTSKEKNTTNTVSLSTPLKDNATAPKSSSGLPTTQTNRSTNITLKTWKKVQTEQLTTILRYSSNSTEYPDLVNTPTTILTTKPENKATEGKKPEASLSMYVGVAILGTVIVVLFCVGFIIVYVRYQSKKTRKQLKPGVLDTAETSFAESTGEAPHPGAEGQNYASDAGYSEDENLLPNLPGNSRDQETVTPSGTLLMRVELLEQNKTEKLLGETTCPGPCRKDISGDLFHDMMAENPRARDLVTNNLDLEPTVCQIIAGSLVQFKYRLEVRSIKSGESLVAKLETAVPDLKLGSFLHLLKNDRVKQAEVSGPKGLCKDLCDALCEELHGDPN